MQKVIITDRNHVKINPLCLKICVRTEIRKETKNKYLFINILSLKIKSVRPIESHFDKHKLVCRKYPEKARH